MDAWRLLSDAPGDPAWNMALDEALLESHRLGFTPPTLRFYSWTPSALSLGYAQPLEDADLDACRREGLAVVRRPTGGRAVLHRGELTYSLVASEGFPASVSGTYQRITEVLARALSRLGLDLTIEPGKLTRSTTASCFQSATRADLLALGRKLVGSAQTRREGAFLQHGSVMLTQRPDEIGRVIRGASTSDAFTCLEALLKKVPERGAIAQSIAEAVTEAWGVPLQPGPLTPWEVARATERQGALRLL